MEVVPGRKGVKWKRVDLKTYGRAGGPGLEKGEGRVWGHQDTRDVGAERQIKKKVQMRGNGEGAKGTCWAPAPGVGGYRGHLGFYRACIGVYIGVHSVGCSSRCWAFRASGSGYHRFAAVVFLS